VLIELLALHSFFDFVVRNLNEAIQSAHGLKLLHPILAILGEILRNWQGEETLIFENWNYFDLSN